MNDIMVPEINDISSPGELSQVMLEAPNDIYFVFVGKYKEKYAGGEVNGGIVCCRDGEDLVSILNKDTTSNDFCQTCKVYRDPIQHGPCPTPAELIVNALLRGFPGLYAMEKRIVPVTEEVADYLITWANRPKKQAPVPSVKNLLRANFEVYKDTTTPLPTITTHHHYFF